MADGKYGKAIYGRGVREIGNYWHGKKINFLFGISGDSQGYQSMNLWEEGGLDIARFLIYIERICNNLEEIDPQQQRRFCFTMDNFSTHMNELVSQLISAI